MSNDLKPCPFCGNLPILWPVSATCLMKCVECREEGCAVTGIIFSVEEWNTRAPVRVKLPGGYCVVHGGVVYLPEKDIIVALKAQGVEVE